MARFYSFEEIEKGLVLTKEQVGTMAQRIMKLPSFQDGRAVVFGSVAWGEHTWRSDIDIANRAKIGESEEMSVGCEIMHLFIEEFGNDDEFCVRSHLIEELTPENPDPGTLHYVFPQISPSTRDHFRLLSRKKKGSYQIFLRNLRRIRSRKREEDILVYIDRINYWYPGLMKRLAEDLAPKNGRIRITWQDFKGLQAFENFPKQLMRKILGQLGKLPCPDTVPNIREAFSTVDETWAQGLWELFEPFFDIDHAYEKLVQRMVEPSTRLNERDYGFEVVSLFEGLPVEDIYTRVSEVYNSTD